VSLYEDTIVKGIIEIPYDK